MQKKTHGLQATALRTGNGKRIPDNSVDIVNSCRRTSSAYPAEYDTSLSAYTLDRCKSGIETRMKWAETISNGAEKSECSNDGGG